jgi:hypothetical protein
VHVVTDNVVGAAVSCNIHQAVSCNKLYPECMIRKVQLMKVYKFIVIGEDVTWGDSSNRYF